MEQLLPYYEQELVLMREYSRVFAERYPRIAGRLDMAGDAGGDPHVERMIQAFALLTGRINKRLDDDYPQLTEALLETLYPHYLRLFPSCSIIRLDSAPDDAPRTVPRGSELAAVTGDEPRCRFTTTAPVTLAPLAVAAAAFFPLIGAPATIRLPPGAGACISITLAGTGAQGLHCPGVDHLRLLIDGDAALCAALRDTLLMRVAAAYVSIEDNGAWHALEQVPLSATGFDADQALIPYPARSHPAYRLLTEYFSFPDKFNFIDIDLAAIGAVLPPDCTRCTLHLALTQVRADSPLARTLAGLSAHQLLTHCVPVVNLFSKPGVPVQLDQTRADYPLLADAAHPDYYEIHSIAAARLVHGKLKNSKVLPLQPFYSLHHGQGPDAGTRYWLTRRDDVAGAIHPGHELRLVLVDGELEQQGVDDRTLSVDLLCSNRGHAANMACGVPGGDLALTGAGCGAGAFADVGGVGGAGNTGGGVKGMARLLRKPTPSWRFGGGKGAHWRLVSHLSLNHRALSSVGLEEFRQMLTLYDLPRSAITQRRIEGVSALHYKVMMAWVPGLPCAALMPGIEVRMTLDETAFVGGGIHLFAQVIDRFFGLYGQINVFSQLLVLSQQSGNELLRFAPRSGEAPVA